MLHLNLLIPDLLPPPWPEAGVPARTLATPALAWLLGHAAVTPLADPSAEHWLCRKHGLSGCPSAPYALLAEGGVPGDGFWLHADPVHLQLNLDRLRVLDARTFRLDGQECQAFLAGLKALVEPLGMEVLAPRPERWYLRLNQDPRLATTVLPLLAGQDMNPRASLGGDQVLWQKLLNEIQVAFHHLPVNEARTEAGVLPVSGIWPWGAGRLEKPMQQPYSHIHDNQSLARGLGMAAGAEVSDLPTGPGAMVGGALALLEDLALPACYGDGTGWLAALERLEETWFVPLARELRAGHVASLRILAPRAQGGLGFTINASDRWRFWRRPRQPGSFPARS